MSKDQAFNEFSAVCTKAGFNPHLCTGTHWQIMDDAGEPIVNYWPTTRKFQAVGSGEKAKFGTFDAAIRLATELEPKQERKAENGSHVLLPEGLAARLAVLRDAIDGVLKELGWED